MHYRHHHTASALLAAAIGCCLVGNADGFGGAALAGIGGGRAAGIPASAGPRKAYAAERAAAAGGVTMKDWSKRDTLADKIGGADDKGFAAVGIEGDIPVIFEQTVAKPAKAKDPLWRRIVRRPSLTPEETAMYSTQPKWRRFLRRPAPGTAPAAPPTEEEEGGEVLNKLETMALVGAPLSSVASQAGQYIKYKCKVGECGTCEVRIDGNWVRTCVAKVPPMDKGAELKVFVRGSMVETKKSTAFFSLSSFISGFKNNALGMVGFVKEGIKGKKNFEDRINKEKELMAQVAARKAAKAAQEGKS